MSPSEDAFPITGRLSKVETLPHTLPMMIFIASLTATYLFWHEQKINADQKLRTYFDSHVRENTLRIEQQLIVYRQVLLGAVGLFSIDKNVTRSQFHEYVNKLKLGNDYPGIQGICFLRLVTREQKAKNVASIRNEGFHEYTIKPEGIRDIYTPVIYIEPFSGENLRAFGHDPYSDPVRRSAMEQARDYDLSAISSKVRLVQETGANVQAGFMMYLPIYKYNSAHDTVTERRSNLIGWVSAPFRVGDMMNKLLSADFSIIDFEIYDGKEMSSETLMYDSDNKPGSRNNARFQSINQISFNNHIWTIASRSNAVFEIRNEDNFALLVVIAGISISVLISWLSWLLVTSRARILDSALDMNRDLLESENRYRTLADSGQALIWTSGTDKLCDYFNKVWLEFTGRSREKELGNGWTEGVHPGDFQKCLDVYVSSFDRRENFIMEYRLRRHDGEYRWIHDEGCPRYNNEGEFIGYIGYCLDITERKLLEIQLRKMSAILNQSNEPVSLVDNEGIYIYANPAFCSIFGYTLDELIGHSFNKMIPKDQENTLSYSQFIAILKQKQSFQGQVMRLSKDGRIIPILLKVTPFINESGAQEGYVSTITDLTEIKKLEMELRNSATMSQMILDSISEGLHGIDREGNIIFENPAAAMLRWDKQELIGLQAHKTIHHTKYDGFAYPQGECPIYISLEDGVRRHVNGECFWRKDGTSFPVDYTCSPMRNAIGDITGAIVSFRDVSVRKAFEDALKESEMFLRQSQSVAGVGSYVLDVQTGWWTSSDVCDEVFGITKSYQRNFEGWVSLVHPDERAMMTNYFQNEVLGQHVPFDKVYRIIRNEDRSNRWIHGLGKLVFDSQGKPLKMYGTIQDITERKLAENELQIAAISFSAQNGMIITDSEAVILRINPAFTQLTGYSAEDSIGKTPAILHSGRQDAEFYKRMWDSLKEKGFWQGEIWNRRKNG